MVDLKWAVAVAGGNCYYYINGVNDGDARNVILGEVERV